VTAPPRRDGPPAGPLLLGSLALLAVAAARLEVTAAPLVALGRAAASLGAAWLVWWGLRGRARGALEGARPLLLVAAGLLSPARELIARSVGAGDPPEVALVAWLADLGLFASAYAHQRSPRQLGALLAGAAALFAPFCVPGGALVGVAAAAFGLALVARLASESRARVRSATAAARVEAARPAWRPLLALALGGLLVWAGAFARPGLAARLPAWLPSSGGDGWFDPFARAGVGDGDASVAAVDRARAFGMLESELHVGSDRPSLYDVFSEQYGDEQDELQTEKAIGLRQEDAREPGAPLSVSWRTGREFSAVRRQPRPASGDGLPEEGPGRALFHVVGEAPVRLALTRYDAFSGRLWSWSGRAPEPPEIRLSRRHGEPWFELDRGGGRLHRGRRDYALRIVRLDTRRVPSPPQLLGVHVLRADRTGLLDWSDDGVPRLAERDGFPPLTVLRLRTRGLDLGPLRAAAAPGPPGPVEPTRRGPRLRAAVAAWTDGVPRGWGRVEAVADRLRADLVHDPDAAAPPDCPDVVEHFLAAGRGPDYMFATTAAVAIRALGYPTRLVGGFYVRPERRPWGSDATPVLPEDVHTWVEVAAAPGTWVPVEPTPGYAPPRETERPAVLAWLGWVLGASLGAVLLWRTRRVWGDPPLTGLSWLLGLGGPARRLRATLRLLEWRGRLAGRRRPSGTTLRRWLGGAALPLETRALEDFLAASDALLYGPRGAWARSVGPGEADRLCAPVRRRLRAAALRDLPGGRP